MATQQKHNAADIKWGCSLSVDGINSAVLFLSRDLQVTVFNKLASDLLEGVNSTGQAMPLSACLRPDADEYHILADMVQTLKEYRDFVITWETNGRIRHVILDSFVKQDDNGSVIGMYAVMKDLGNLTSLEHQMNRTDKLVTVGKVAAGIAHEIRNPLTTIKGFLQVLEHRFESSHMDVELEYAQMMMHEIDRVNALVSELLWLSKPQKVEKKSCSVGRLLEDMQPLISEEARERGFSFQCNLSPDAPQVIADEGMLKQVILNIVKNAFEAMEPGGVLRIQMRESAGWVAVDVSDTGPGIPYYQVDRIFDAFFTTKEKGTGLGLPICQRIMEHHGGEIRVSSKGFGTTFSVLIPLPAHSIAN